MPNRSISISLDERLLTQPDALQIAYADLAKVEGGDLNAAGEDAITMAERGRLYQGPRNRSFGDSKARPVLVNAPDAATRLSRRWVVLLLITEQRLGSNPLAYMLGPSPTNGLPQASLNSGRSIGSPHQCPPCPWLSPSPPLPLPPVP